jgi:hypothetical protein
MENEIVLNAKGQTRTEFNAVVNAKFDAALAKAEGKVEATIVVKVPRAAHVTISPFQVKLFDVAFRSAKALCDATQSQRQVMRDMLKSQYGDTCPTFEQLRSDRDALRVLALERGLVDDQWVRKPYNAALIELYKALPVSMSPAAILKRAQRPDVVKAAAGSKKNVVKASDPAAVDTVGQFIAKFGTAAVLLELAKILATERTTALDAKTLQAVAKHYVK